MRDITVLIGALDYIEENISKPLNVESLAKVCHLSSSGLQKLFAYAFSCSVNDYITKRRLSCASKELITSSKSIIDIAYDCQYGSPEAFSRAFKRFWGISPDKFRKTRRFTELLPKFKLEIKYGGITMQKRRPIDISDLYDELKRMRGTYVLGIDIIHFDQVNKNHGYAAGDIVIAEAFYRLEQSIDENMILFRIGGDEFAIVTGYNTLEDTKALAEKITSHNGKVVKIGILEIPLSLRIGLSQLPTEALNYYKALEIMYNSMDKSRSEDDKIVMYTED